jgi:hypothetical protein
MHSSNLILDMQAVSHEVYSKLAIRNVSSLNSLYKYEMT